MGEWRSHCDWRAICHLAEKEGENAIASPYLPPIFNSGFDRSGKSVTLLREVIAWPRISLLRGHSAAWEK